MPPTSIKEVFLSTPSARRATVTANETSAMGVISIHALWEEGDMSSKGIPAAALRFLSTPSARRATDAVGVGGLGQLISIHALCEEGDAAAL